MSYVIVITVLVTFLATIALLCLISREAREGLIGITCTIVFLVVAFLGALLNWLHISRQPASNYEEGYEKGEFYWVPRNPAD